MPSHKSSDPFVPFSVPLLFFPWSSNLFLFLPDRFVTLATSSARLVPIFQPQTNPRVNGKIQSTQFHLRRKGKLSAQKKHDSAEKSLSSSCVSKTGYFFPLQFDIQLCCLESRPYSLARGPRKRRHCKVTLRFPSRLGARQIPPSLYRNGRGPRGIFPHFLQVYF